MGYAANVTVIVPTLNRSYFVNRMLEAFRATGFLGRVLIGDSSTAEHVESTAQAIAALRGAFPVIHRALPGQNVFECIAELIPLIETPYALWMCDDDFLIPRTLEACARFLDDKSSYSAAGGVSILVELDPSDPAHVRSTGRNRVEAIEEETASARLLRLLGHYSVVGYSLSRTEQFVKRFRPAVSPELTDVALGTELLPSCMHVAQGKVKMLDQLFVVRLKHGHHYLFPDGFEWITSSHWPESYAVFRDCLARELVQRDGLAFEDAQAVVKRAFWGYLAKHLLRQWRGRGLDPQSSAAGGWRSLVKRWLPVQRMRAWRQRQEDRSAGCQLDQLLSGRSAYAKDFLPVYQIVTQRRASAGQEALVATAETSREWNETS